MNTSIRHSLEHTTTRQNVDSEPTPPPPATTMRSRFSSRASVTSRNNSRSLCSSASTDAIKNNDDNDTETYISEDENNDDKNSDFLETGNNEKANIKVHITNSSSSSLTSSKADVQFEDFEEASSMNSSYSDLFDSAGMGMGGRAVQVRQRGKTPQIAPLVVQDPEVFKVAEVACKATLSSAARSTATNNSKSNIAIRVRTYLALGALAWELGRYNSAIVWFKQAQSAERGVKSLSGEETGGKESTARTTTREGEAKMEEEMELLMTVGEMLNAVEGGQSRASFIWRFGRDSIDGSENELDVPTKRKSEERRRKTLHNSPANSNPSSSDTDPVFTIHQVVFAIVQILRDCQMDREYIDFITDLSTGLYGKQSRENVVEITLVCVNDYARLGYPDAVLTQAREALTHSRRAFGRKSSHVAFLTLEVSSMLRRNGKHKQALSVWMDAKDALARTAPDAGPTVAYFTRVLEDGEKSKALDMEVDMLIGTLRRSLVEAVEADRAGSGILSNDAAAAVVVVENVAKMIVAGLRRSERTRMPNTRSFKRSSKRRSSTHSWFFGGNTGSSSASDAGISGIRSSISISGANNNDVSSSSTHTLLAFCAWAFAKSCTRWDASADPVTKLQLVLRVHELTRGWKKGKNGPGLGSVHISATDVATPIRGSTSLSLMRKRPGLIKTFLGGDGNSAHRSVSKTAEDMMLGIVNEDSRSVLSGQRPVHERRTSKGRHMSSKQLDKKLKTPTKFQEVRDEENEDCSSVTSISRPAPQRRNVDGARDVSLVAPQGRGGVDDLIGGTSRHNFENLLLKFYEENVPEKVTDLNAILANFYGREEVLIGTLELKYNMRFSEHGFEPLGKKDDAPFDTLLLDRGVSYKSTLVSFFRAVSPERVDQVDDLLGEYADRESELIHRLQRKYTVVFRNNGTFVNVSEADKLLFHPADLGHGDGGTNLAFHKILEAFYERYAPDKLADLDTIVLKFQGRESTLIHTLELKYKVRFQRDGSVLEKNNTSSNKNKDEKKKNKKAHVPSIHSDKRQWRKVLKLFYRTHAPEKLADIDTILERFDGKERLLLRTLEAKYGVSASESSVGYQNKHGEEGEAETALTAVSERSEVGSERGGGSERWTGGNGSIGGGNEPDIAGNEPVGGGNGPIEGGNEPIGGGNGAVNVGGEKQEVSLADQLRNSLEAFYQVYYPDKLDQVDKILANFKGKESELFGILRTQYGISIDESGVPRRVEGKSFVKVSSGADRRSKDASSSKSSSVERRREKKERKEKKKEERKEVKKLQEQEKENEKKAKRDSGTSGTSRNSRRSASKIKKKATRRSSSRRSSV